MIELIHFDDVEAGLTQLTQEPLGDRAFLEANLRRRLAERRQRPRIAYDVNLHDALNSDTRSPIVFGIRSRSAARRPRSMPHISWTSTVSSMRFAESSPRSSRKRVA